MAGEVRVVDHTIGAVILMTPSGALDAAAASPDRYAIIETPADPQPPTATFAMPVVAYQGDITGCTRHLMERLDFVANQTRPDGYMWSTMPQSNIILDAHDRSGGR